MAYKAEIEDDTLTLTHYKHIPNLEDWETKANILTLCHVPTGSEVVAIETSDFDSTIKVAVKTPDGQLYVFHYSMELLDFPFTGSTEDTGPFVVTALY